MREVVLGSLLFVIVLAAALPSAFASRAGTAAPTPSPSHSASTTGPGIRASPCCGSVRPPGYSIAVLTGPIRSQIAIVADRKLDQLVVPDAWVTPVR